MSTPDVGAYLEMQRATYADLAARSDYATEAFVDSNAEEFVVGSYALHEQYDYERWLLGGLVLGATARALEYGCGPGRMLLRFAPRFAQVDGVDLSPELLEVARRRCAALPRPPELILTDGQGLPATVDSRYDLAFSVICLQHVCVHRVRRAILEALFRSLHPGGILTFQMGYGPGHAACLNYADNHTAATGTNGSSDVTVLHPGELATDLTAIGFTEAAYALTPTGPGDVHAAWMFVRAIKPGESAAVHPQIEAWPALGFQPLVRDGRAVRRARALHQGHNSLMHRYRHLTQYAADLEARVAALECDLQTLVSASRVLQATHDSQTQRLAIAEAQLQRVVAADRTRLRARVAALVREARQRDLRVGVFGAGAHTCALLDETDLRSIRRLSLFDNHPPRWGTTVGTLTVQPPHAIGAAALDVMLVSSLAFEPDIVEQLERLRLPGLRVVPCYADAAPSSLDTNASRGGDDVPRCEV